MVADPACEIAPVTTRQLQLQDLRVVHKYKEALLQQLEAHKIIEKVEALKEVSITNQ